MSEPELSGHFPDFMSVNVHSDCDSGFDSRSKIQPEAPKATAAC